MARTADALGAEIENEQSDPIRPVIWGAATDGEAWDDYRAALTAIRADAEERVASVIVARRGGETSRGERDRLVADHASALAHLRMGAHRRRATYPVRPGSSFPGVMYSTRKTLGSLCLFRAEQLLETGRPARAVELLLDALQFSRDEMQAQHQAEAGIGAGLMQAITMPRPGYQGLLDRLLALPREELVPLARGLRILDEGLPLAPRYLRYEHVYLMNRARGPGGLDYFCRGTFPRWRAAGFAFSDRLVVADCMLTIAEKIEELGHLANGPWSELIDFVNRCGIELQRSRNPLTRIFSHLPNYRGRREALASLRMLRMAVGHRLSGRVTPLPDPFGDLLRHEVTDDALRIWSRGNRPNGKPLPHHRREFRLARSAAGPK